MFYSYGREYYHLCSCVCLFSVFVTATAAAASCTAHIRAQMANNRAAANPRETSVRVFVSHNTINFGSVWWCAWCAVVSICFVNSLCIFKDDNSRHRFHSPYAYLCCAYATLLCHPTTHGGVEIQFECWSAHSHTQTHTLTRAHFSYCQLVYLIYRVYRRYVCVSLCACRIYWFCCFSTLKNSSNSRYRGLISFDARYHLFLSSVRFLIRPNCCTKSKSPRNIKMVQS